MGKIIESGKAPGHHVSPPSDCCDASIIISENSYREYECDRDREHAGDHTDVRRKFTAYWDDKGNWRIEEHDV
jgi:hypothetical protein